MPKPRNHDDLRLLPNYLTDAAPKDPQREARRAGKAAITTTWGDVLSRVVEATGMEPEEALTELNIDWQEVADGKLIDFNDTFGDYEYDRVRSCAHRLEPEFAGSKELLLAEFTQIKEAWQLDETEAERVHLEAEDLNMWAEGELRELRERLNSARMTHNRVSPLKKELREVVTLAEDLQQDIANRVLTLQDATALTTLEDFTEACFKASFVNLENPDANTYVWLKALKTVVARKEHRLGESRLAKVNLAAVLVNDGDIDEFERVLRTGFWDYANLLADQKWAVIADAAFLANNAQAKRMLEGTEV